MAKTNIWMIVLFLVVLTPIGVNALGSQGFPIPGSEIPTQSDEYILDFEEQDILLPGNSLYPAKIFVENLRLAFTFDQEKKLDLKLEFFEERIREARALKNTGQDQRANLVLNETLTDYDELLSDRNLPQSAIENINRNKVLVDRISIDRDELTEQIENIRAERIVVNETRRAPSRPPIIVINDTVDNEVVDNVKDVVNETTNASTDKILDDELVVPVQREPDNTRDVTSDVRDVTNRLI